MTASSREQFVHQLVAHDPDLGELLAEHLEDNDGELQADGFFDALTRWIDARSRDGEHNLELAAVIDDLEAALEGEDTDVEQLVAGSFLEDLDDESPVLLLLTDHARAVRDEVLNRAP